MILFKKVPQDLQKGIYKLARNQLNLSSQCGYEHEIVQCFSPVVWISKDGLEISDDEITHARDFCQDIRISNELADLDMKGKLKISRSICNMNVIQWIRTVVIFSSVCGLVFFSFSVFVPIISYQQLVYSLSTVMIDPSNIVKADSLSGCLNNVGVYNKVNTVQYYCTNLNLLWGCLSQYVSYVLHSIA